MVSRVLNPADGDVKGKKIAVLGVTFKGQTDDMRDSTSLILLPALQEKGATVVAFDPSQSARSSRPVAGRGNDAHSPRGCDRSDVLVILTDWMVFKTYNFKEIASVMATPVMVDLRNMFPPQAQKNGFINYISLGR